jgi:TolB-like protein
MVIWAPLMGASEKGRISGPRHTTAEPGDTADTGPPAGSELIPERGFDEFVEALRDALRNFHRADLLGRNPLVRERLCGLDERAGPTELKALLTATVGRLFGSECDEKLRRVIELTYFEPALKQEAVADRLSLPFGTYRRHLTTARDRLALWLWESPAPAQTAAGLPTLTEPTNEPTLSSGDPGAPRLSVVILPFLKLGDCPRCEAFVDGLTETLTTDLSRAAGVFVISRNTAFAYRDKPVDARRIGRELGVRYVVEGSVQFADDRGRFNAQLVDAESGAHLWADRFDRQRTDFLELQDEITTRLARSIRIELVAAESRRTEHEHPDRLDALDHIIHGWAAWNQRPSLGAAQQARSCFEAALHLDGDNVHALLGLANSHMWEVNMFASDDRVGQIRAAEVAATKALGLVPTSAEAHLTYGMVLFAAWAPERGLRECQLAIDLDGHLAVAHAYLGLIKILLGRAGETKGHVAEAMRLSPRDPLLFHWHFAIGIADVYLGRVVHGIESLRKSVEIFPNWGLAQFMLAGALGLAGLRAEAAEVCATGRCLLPNFTIAKFRSEAMSDHPVYLAQREYFYNGLQVAGVPEA